MRPRDREFVPTRSALLAAWLALALPLVGCTRDDHPRGDAPDPPPPNVILITLDTVRADRLGCYGYGQPTSPRLDAFARRATLYRHAVAAAPWTVPSHASLFTGRFPFEHAARNFPVEKPGNNVNPLPERNVTLAEALKALGYRTGAFVANEAYLNRRWGLAQGFDVYHVENAYVATINARVRPWLGDSPGTPFFLFINYIDAHWPYNNEPRPGLPEPRPRDKLRNHLAVARDALLPGPGAAPFPENALRHLSDAYDLSIANLDDGLGALLDALDSMGLLDGAVVVITSDHGEYFGEHHLLGHSKDVYEPVLRVPLLVKAPRQSLPAVVDTPATSTDVPALIAAHFPPRLARGLGRQFPDLPGNHLVISESYYTLPKDLFHPRWGARFDRVRTAVYDADLKLIHSSDGADELYDLAADPDERHNLIEARRADAERLLRQLQAFQAQRGQAAESLDARPLSDDEMKRLRSLGYVDS